VLLEALLAGEQDEPLQSVASTTREFPGELFSFSVTIGVGPNTYWVCRRIWTLLPHRLAVRRPGTRFLFLRRTPGLMLLPNG